MKVTTAKNKKAKIEKVNRQKVYIEIAVGIIALLLVPVLAFLLLEWYGHNPFEEVREKAMWFNIFLFELIAWILFFVTGKARLALRLELVAAMVFGLANTYVVKFRTNPIVPWDFMSIRTAASVASNYDLTPDKRMLLVSGLFLLLIAVLQFVKLRLPMLALKRQKTCTASDSGRVIDAGTDRFCRKVTG